MEEKCRPAYAHHAEREGGREGGREGVDTCAPGDRETQGYRRGRKRAKVKRKTDLAESMTPKGTL